MDDSARVELRDRLRVMIEVEGDVEAIAAAKEVQAHMTRLFFIPPSDDEGGNRIINPKEPDTIWGPLPRMERWVYEFASCCAALHGCHAWRTHQQWLSEHRIVAVGRSRDLNNLSVFVPAMVQVLAGLEKRRELPPDAEDDGSTMRQFALAVAQGMSATQDEIIEQMRADGVKRIKTPFDRAAMAERRVKKVLDLNDDGAFGEDLKGDVPEETMRTPSGTVVLKH